MKKLIFIFFFIFLCFLLKAQNPEAKRANHWYFGNGAGLDFSSGSPVAVTDGKLDSYESCASISDINGNLLFYTDGDTIWDKSHNVMPNGTGLYGNCSPPGPNNSATQGVIIIPQPKSDNLFYVFTVDCAENLGMKGMNYSIVDLNQNSGFGDVTLKNQILFAPSTEAIAATTNCAKDSVWVVAHEIGNSKFYAYLVTETGLNINPVISNIGIPVMNYEGQMKFSPSGKKIINYTELFDFNFFNGTIINNLLIPLFGYGRSFSPDSKRLYICSSGNLIGQYDITLNNQTDITNSVQIIYQGLSNNEYYGLQLGNDQRLYIAPIDKSKISRIDNPNNTGVSANFNPYSVDLNGKICQFTFPSFIESYFNNGSTTICFDNKFTSIPNVFSPNNDGNNDFFSIKVSGYEEISYTIFNRWGNKIKNEELKITNTGVINLWDGNINGNKASDGVYYYIINLNKQGGETKTEKGFLHLFN